MAKRSTAGRYHGFLIIDKPLGWTSHDVVGWVRKLTGERRVGHAGTLDPAATGVMQIAVGHATKSVEYLANADKTYIADCRFGRMTDSGDQDGRLIDANDVIPERSDIEAVLPTFLGEQSQVPPMHSAIQVEGKRLYDLARRGEVVHREPRSVTISRLELIRFDAPVARILVTCSKGTYIRSLIEDLGHALGAMAMLDGLQRVRSGPFTIDEAWQLDRLAEAFHVRPWIQVAVHPDAGVSDVPAVVIGMHNARDWLIGRPIALAAPSGPASMYDGAGVWLGTGVSDPALPVIRPRKVIAP